MPTFRLTSSPAWPGTPCNGYTSNCCSPMDDVLPPRRFEAATLAAMAAGLSAYCDEIKKAHPSVGFVAHVSHVSRDRKLSGYNKAKTQVWHYPEGCTEEATMAWVNAKAA